MGAYRAVADECKGAGIKMALIVATNLKSPVPLDSHLASGRNYPSRVREH